MKVIQPIKALLKKSGTFEFALDVANFARKPLCVSTFISATNLTLDLLYYFKEKLSA